MQQYSYVFSVWHVIYTLVMMVMTAGIALKIDHQMFKILFSILFVSHLMLLTYIIYKKYNKKT
jgi:hypothetical protein